VIANRLAATKARTDQMTDLSVGVAVMRSELRGLILSVYERAQQGDASHQFEKSEQTFRAKAAGALAICGQYRAGAEEGASQINSIKAGIGDWLRLFDEIAAIANQGRADDARILAATKLRPIMVAIEGASQGLVDINRRRYAEAMADAASSSTRTIYLSSLFGVAMLGAGIAGLIVSLRIAGQLRKVADHIAAGSSQVNAAASQISSSGQGLAQASTEQAASLQDTSSSVQGVAELAHQNRQRSNDAAKLVETNSSVLSTATVSLSKMSQSMADTEESGRKVSGIIKVIDGIAFQTNILALNAAVEAARAGEAGMGFAVVADEVRNLAQRCAAAAHDTSELIEQSNSSTNRARDDAKDVASAVLAVADTSSQLASLVAGLATSSNEQDAGVEQIARAISQFEGTTQSIAANAEESAAAGTELSSQADALNQIVDELAEMAGGLRRNGREF
jgi:methyl-accepting chemotaxis protein/methyl-accepting chemotaxis protein-1 (serine sensor receptor)